MLTVPPLIAAAGAAAPPPKTDTAGLLVEVVLPAMVTVPAEPAETVLAYTCTPLEPLGETSPPLIEMEPPVVDTVEVETAAMSECASTSMFPAPVESVAESMKTPAATVALTLVNSVPLPSRTMAPPAVIEAAVTATLPEGDFTSTLPFTECKEAPSIVTKLFAALVLSDSRSCASSDAVVEVREPDTSSES
jgi:hypothetical protein